MQSYYKKTLLLGFILLLLLPSCQQQPKIYLLCAEEDRDQMTLHENLPLLYRGFKIGEGKLLDLNGTYEFVVEEDKVQILPTTKFSLAFADVLGGKYMDVDTLSLSTEASLTQADTFYYHVQTRNQVIPAEFIELMDGLTSSMDSLLQHQIREGLTEQE